MPSPNKTVLVVAAHPDDEVLGCGGTIARFALDGYSVNVLLLADGETSRDDIPNDNIGNILVQRKNMANQACGILGCASVKILRLPDNRMDSLDLLDVVKEIEAIIDSYQPIKILTHHIGDLNIDHRIVHEAVVTACRPKPNHPTKELLFFEIPSSTEWRPASPANTFQPNYFIDISNTIDIKLQALQVYKKELEQFPHPRSLKAVESLAQWRGATVGVVAAEAFILGRKLI